MWATTKRFSAMALAGAIVGAIVASFIAPRFISWYNTPSSAVAAMCECSKLASEVTSKLLWAQFSGAIIGAVLAIAIGVIVVRSRKSNAAPPATPATPAVPPAVGA